MRVDAEEGARLARQRVRETGVHAVAAHSEASMQAREAVAESQQAAASADARLERAEARANKDKVEISLEAPKSVRADSVFALKVSFKHASLSGALVRALERHTCDALHHLLLRAPRAAETAEQRELPSPLWVEQRAQRPCPASACSRRQRRRDLVAGCGPGTARRSRPFPLRRASRLRRRCPPRPSRRPGRSPRCPSRDSTIPRFHDSTIPRFTENCESGILFYSSGASTSRWPCVAPMRAGAARGI